MNLSIGLELAVIAYKIVTGILSLKKSDSLPDDKSEFLAGIIGRIATDLNKVFEDGKLDISDVTTIIKLITDISGLIDFDFKKAMDELLFESAKADGPKEALERFKLEFDLSNDISERQIESLLDTLFIITSASSRLYKQIRNINEFGKKEKESFF